MSPVTLRYQDGRAEIHGDLRRALITAAHHEEVNGISIRDIVDGDRSLDHSSIATNREADDHSVIAGRKDITASKAKRRKLLKKAQSLREQADRIEMEAVS